MNRFKEMRGISQWMGMDTSICITHSMTWEWEAMALEE